MSVDIDRDFIDLEKDINTFNITIEELTIVGREYHNYLNYRANINVSVESISEPILSSEGLKEFIVNALKSLIELLKRMVRKVVAYTRKAAVKLTDTVRLTFDHSRVDKIKHVTWSELLGKNLSNEGYNDYDNRLLHVILDTWPVLYRSNKPIDLVNNLSDRLYLFERALQGTNYYYGSMSLIFDQVVTSIERKFTTAEEDVAFMDKNLYPLTRKFLSNLNKDIENTFIGPKEFTIVNYSDTKQMDLSLHAIVGISSLKNEVAKHNFGLYKLKYSPILAYRNGEELFLHSGEVSDVTVTYSAHESYVKKAHENILSPDKHELSNVVKVLYHLKGEINRSRARLELQADNVERIVSGLEGNIVRLAKAIENNLTDKNTVKYLYLWRDVARLHIEMLSTISKAGVADAEKTADIAYLLFKNINKLSKSS